MIPRITGCLLLLCLFVSSVFTGTTLSDVMARQCGETIYLSDYPSKSLVLMLTSEMRYTGLLDCHVTVAVEERVRIQLSFLEMDIRSFGFCTGDFLVVLDSQPLTEEVFYFQDNSIERYCGTNIPDSVTSTGNNLTLWFVSNAHASGKGFSLLLTAFHESECEAGEFKCDNNRCIDKALQCDDFDNCGDNSDSCRLPVYLIAGIAVVSILVLLSALFLLVVWRYRCRQKQFESENMDFEAESHLDANDRHIPSISATSTRLPAVASGAPYVSHLMQSPYYNRFFLGPQDLLGLPSQNNVFTFT